MDYGHYEVPNPLRHMDFIIIFWFWRETVLEKIDHTILMSYINPRVYKLFRHSLWTMAKWPSRIIYLLKTYYLIKLANSTMMEFGNGWLVHYCDGQQEYLQYNIQGTYQDFFIKMYPISGLSSAKSGYVWIQMEAKTKCILSVNQSRTWVWLTRPQTYSVKSTQRDGIDFTLTAEAGTSQNTFQGFWSH
jgi:hypothetical protein